MKFQGLLIGLIFAAVSFTAKAGDNFASIARQCAPAVHPATMAAVVRVESDFNPYAIGVVGGRLERQPANKAEAVVTAQALEAQGFNFSVGVGQVNRYNLPKYGLNYETAFEPCSNLRAASLILKDCFDRAKASGLSDQDALQAAISCYYSGNFSTGFRPDFKGQPSYVQKVLDSATGGNAGQAVAPIRVIAASRPKAAAKPRNDGAFRITVADARAGSVIAGDAAAADSVMVYR